MFSVVTVVCEKKWEKQWSRIFQAVFCLWIMLKKLIEITKPLFL
jgi:hypothetical protein